MTNPFTSYAFPTADAGTINRTLPNRLADIKNVKDFGATGNGTTDDWAAIMAAVNATSGTVRGTIFFPVGTYKVSAPIDFSGDPAHDISICFLGVYGASIVVGNFNNFVFNREVADPGGFSGWHTLENLTVINTHATGGGVRIGYSLAPAIRNCVITANRAINTASADGRSDVYSGEFIIENCTLSPGSNPSGSVGINYISSGPTIGCSITGFDTGIYSYGQQGNQILRGCKIELCAVGVFGYAVVMGCLFKNCGTAVSGGGGFYHGVRIEGAEGTISGNPQYGIHLAANTAANALYSGIIVTGQFEQYGIAVEGGEAFIARTKFVAVQSTNTSGLGSWSLPTSAGTVQCIGCNATVVGELDLLPAPVYPLTAISWTASGIVSLGAITAGTGGTDGPYDVSMTGGTGSGATAHIVVSGGIVDSVTLQAKGTGYVNGDTLSASSGSIGGTTGFSVPVSVAGGVTTLVALANFTPIGTADNVINVTIAGVTPSGYNGAFTGASPGGAFNALSYPQTNPGGSSGTVTNGTATVNVALVSTPDALNAAEGHCYNVSDGTNGLTWGDIATNTGTHTTHYKVRWNGSNWIVVGK